MDRFKKFIDHLGRQKEKLTGKRIVLIVVIAAILITPTALASTYVIYQEFVRQDEHFSVILYDSEGELIATEARAPEKSGHYSLTGIFYNIILEKGDDIPIPTGLTDNVHLKAEINHNGEVSELICYFLKENDTGYFINNGKCYLISKKLNNEFLSTAYAEILYPHAIPFSLTTIDNDVITPKSVDWKYKSVTGKYLTAEKVKTTDKLKTYEITGALEVIFEVLPSSASAHVYSDNELIFTGDAQELSALTVDTNHKLRVYIVADWVSVDEAESYGRITYEFYVHIKNRSSFSLSSDTVSAGGFFTLDCTNITDISKLSFKEESDSIKPIFSKYGNLWRALIPISENTPVGDVSFTVTYGASSDSFTVHILPPADKGSYSFPTLLFDTEDAPALLNNSIYSSIFETPLPAEEQVYFRGNFANPGGQGYTAVYTHGSEIKWGEELGYSYATLGNEYILNDKSVIGGSVRAIQNGVVAYVGSNSLLGSFVVIDHGCGLRTWYTHLRDIDVSIGDILLSGQHIGKTSNETLSGGEGFILYCTAYDVMIDPDTLWDIKR